MLKDRIDLLPSVPEWKQIEIDLPGAITKGPIRLYYRDGLECFEHLFSDPTFADSMQYCPRKVWKDSSRECRLYDEIMTGDKAWNTQVCCLLTLLVVAN